MPRLNSFCSVASSRITSPLTLRLRMTMMRSESPMISGSSDEIRITPRPCLAKLHIIW